MSRYYSDRTLKTLFALSGNVCALPNCSSNLISEEVILADICHIEAESIGGPRYNPTLSDKDRNAAKNLILFCPTHHRLVDQKTDEYTVEYLRSMKKNHEIKHAGPKKQFKISKKDLESFKQQVLNASVNSQGDHNTNVSIAASGGTTIIGLTPDQVREQFVLLFPQFMPVAMREVEERLKSLSNEFAVNFSDKVSNDDLQRALGDPDFVFFMNDVRKSAVRTLNKDTHKILARLIARKASKSLQVDRQGVAMSKVPEVIEALTMDQLKLLTARFLGTNVSLTVASSASFVNSSYANFIRPLGKTKFHTSDLEQLVTVGAGRLSIGSNGITTTIKSTYLNLFIKPLDINTVKMIGISEANLSVVLIKQPDGYHVTQPFKTWEELHERIRTYETDTSKVDQLYQLLKQNEMSDDEAMSFAKQDMPYVHKLMSLDKVNSVQNFSLNGTGRLAALVYLETLTGQEFDLDIWVPIKDDEVIDFS